MVQEVVGSSPISHPKVDKACVGSTGTVPPTTLYGPVSEWLGVGLQNRLRWFESNRDLKYVLVEQLVLPDTQIRKCGEMVSSRSPKPLLGVRISPLAQMAR